MRAIFKLSHGLPAQTRNGKWATLIKWLSTWSPSFLQLANQVKNKMTTFLQYSIGLFLVEWILAITHVMIGLKPPLHPPHPPFLTFCSLNAPHSRNRPHEKSTISRWTSRGLYSCQYGTVTIWFSPSMPSRFWCKKADKIFYRLESDSFYALHPQFWLNISVYVSKSIRHHCFRQWFGDCSVPSHCLKNDDSDWYRIIALPGSNEQNHWRLTIKCKNT